MLLRLLRFRPSAGTTTGGGGGTQTVTYLGQVITFGGVTVTYTPSGG